MLAAVRQPMMGRNKPVIWLMTFLYPDSFGLPAGFAETFLIDFFTICNPILYYGIPYCHVAFRYER